jgi:hypothetical protein
LALCGFDESNCVVDDCSMISRELEVLQGKLVYNRVDFDNCCIDAMLD